MIKNKPIRQMTIECEKCGLRQIVSIKDYLIKRNIKCPCKGTRFRLIRGGSPPIVIK
jgi:Zn finger protein HypA/HybF involved in hydrogenase expression